MTIFFKRSALVASIALYLAGAAHAADKKFDIVNSGDATAPIIRASTNTVINFTGTTPANVVGSLDAADSTFNRPNGNATSCTSLSVGSGTNVAYDTITFTNNTASNATVNIRMGAPGSPAAQCASAPDTTLVMYNGAFNPAQSLQNCAGTNVDTSGSDVCSTLSGITIPAGAVRVFVLTAYRNVDVVAGLFPYEVTFGGTTPVSLQNFSVD